MNPTTVLTITAVVALVTGLVLDLVGSGLALVLIPAGGLLALALTFVALAPPTAPAERVPTPNDPSRNQKPTP